MWPLLLCSVVAVTVIIERLYVLGRARVDLDRFITELDSAVDSRGALGAREVCARTRGPVAATLYRALGHAAEGRDAVEKALESASAVEVALLERGLHVMATVANVAPLLGFLGTVSGMIHAFESIAAAEQVSAKIVASGISEALTTTEAGLVVAIPVSAMSSFFVSRIDRFVVDIHEASAELLIRLEQPAAAEGARR